jgi:hypothetical protein
MSVNSAAVLGALFTVRPACAWRGALCVRGYAQCRQPCCTRPAAAGVHLTLLCAAPAPHRAHTQFGAAPRPRTLGLQSYGPDVKTLGLCPPTPNCISTAEELNDPDHFVPPWTYNPQVAGGAGRRVDEAAVAVVGKRCWTAQLHHHPAQGTRLSPCPRHRMAAACASP